MTTGPVASELRECVSC